MIGSPWVWLLAGPNGAGKSTFAPNLSADVEEIVRPDELAYSLSPDAPERVAVKSGRLAIDKIRTLLAERRSFAVETTLSGRFHLEIARRAKTAGWKVGVLYRTSKFRLSPSSGFGCAILWADIMYRSLMFVVVIHEVLRISLMCTRPPTESWCWTTLPRANQ
jgi:hypothetical protein